jgi:hypothetical protein
MYVIAYICAYYDFYDFLMNWEPLHEDNAYEMRKRSTMTKKSFRVLFLIVFLIRFQAMQQINVWGPKMSRQTMEQQFANIQIFGCIEKCS